MAKISHRTRAAAAMLAALFVLMPNVGAQTQKGRWVAAWGSSMQGLEPNTTLTNASVRMIARSSLDGGAVRVRLENTFGTAPLLIGGAYVALRASLAGLVEGSAVRVTFNGSPTVTIPAGGTTTSDAAALPVRAGQDVAVTFWVPGAAVPVTSHSRALTTSYLTADGAGDRIAGDNREFFTRTTMAMYFLSAVDVLSDSARGAIVAFGDSITDGTCATLDAHDRWEDVMASRLQLAGRGDFGVVNEGIGGNTVTRQNLVPPPNSPPGLERFDRDVLQRSGATHVIVFEGTNDIRRGATAAQVMAGLQEIVTRLKAAGLKAIGVTIIPRHNVAPTADSTGWDAAKTAIRNAVNDWIRHRGGFDSVIDFDEVVRKAGNHDLIDPAYNCGDGIHPNPFGYLAMGRAVRLDVFK